MSRFEARFETGATRAMRQLDQLSDSRPAEEFPVFRKGMSPFDFTEGVGGTGRGVSPDDNEGKMKGSGRLGGTSTGREQSGSSRSRRKPAQGEQRTGKTGEASSRQKKKPAGNKEASGGGRLGGSSGEGQKSVAGKQEKKQTEKPKKGKERSNVEVNRVIMEAKEQMAQRLFKKPYADLDNKDRIRVERAVSRKAEQDIERELRPWRNRDVRDPYGDDESWGTFLGGKGSK